MTIEHLAPFDVGRARIEGHPHRLERDQLEQWLMFRGGSLEETIEFFAMAERKGLPARATVQPFARVNGYSGYEYRLGDECRAEIGFSPLRWGGFAIHKVFSGPEGRKETWELYSETGGLESVDGALFLDVLYVDLTEMDPRCPILSHLYNYLAHEYDQAQVGSARSKQIKTVETILRRLPVTPLHRDAAILAAWRRALDIEADPVLDWEERQKSLANLFAERDRIVRTKQRAHGVGRGGFVQGLLIRLGDWANRARRVRLRPGSNIRGFSYKYTIGVLLWFLKTVRGNIGYSMALAIYGPFTFYFITQPLNPHAMWAVGRVRTGYLEVTQKVSGLFEKAGTDPGSSDGKAATASGSGPAPASKAVEIPPAPTEESSKHLGLPLSTDFREVDSQNWADRMSNFKNMQIGYEENMQFAARMGRLEQMETQLNFSMIVDSTWEETERYLDQVGDIRASLSSAKKLSPEIAGFLDDEATRARRLEMYVWDRLLRYILDHPYVVMDQSKEQVYRDYYMGRSILLLRDMTRKLSSRESGFRKPADYKRLETVAAAFEKTRIEGDTVLDRLKKNSRLFNQKDRTDGNELRSYMRRQWEILYLLQNKAQEASNFGLQTYTWSVRNTVWLLQSLYSAKRREMALLFQSPGKPKEAVVSEIKAQIEPLYEQLFHMMNLEFASIRPELSGRLANDIEFRQRKVVIDTVEGFLNDRDRVLRGMIR